MNNLWILALAGDEAENVEGTVITSDDETSDAQQTFTQADGTNGTPESQPPQKKPQQQMIQFMFIILIVFLMYMMLFKGPRKKQQEHTRMIKSLSKNDRVRTVGGILGTVIDVKDDEIVLKIDESNNTKIHVTPAAIGAVLSDEKSS